MKTLAIALALLAAPLCASAQTIDIGVKLGFTSAPLSDDDYAWKSPRNDIYYAGAGSDKLGYSAGIFALVGISEYFAVQPELLYSARDIGLMRLGGGINETMTTDDLTVSLRYIDIALLLRLSIPVEEWASLTASVGPLLSFRASAPTVSGTRTTHYTYRKEKVEPLAFDGFDAAPSDIGAEVRLGGDYRIFGSRFTGEFRYTHGYKVVSSSIATSEGVGGGDLVHRAFALSLGYILPL